MAWARGRLDENLSVEHLRVEAARERVESGTGQIDHIALDTGFGDPERMRRAFLRAFGQPPQALRRAARMTGRMEQEKGGVGQLPPAWNV